VISIAVIHHFATEERRIRALQELWRILKPGGTLLVFVWAKEKDVSYIRPSYLREKHGDHFELFDHDT
jgi:alkylated DNA repair protein alkB family protein 8